MERKFKIIDEHEYLCYVTRWRCKNCKIILCESEYYDFNDYFMYYKHINFVNNCESIINENIIKEIIE